MLNALIEINWWARMTQWKRIILDTLYDGILCSYEKLLEEPLSN